MFNNKSDYALNKKDSNAIVYKTADGSIIRLTCEYFANEEEFLRWKAWSDEEYRIRDNREHEDKKETLSLESLSDKAASSPSVDDILIEIEKHKEYKRKHDILLKSMPQILTKKQLQRLWSCRIARFSEDVVAKQEGVTQPAIALSIRQSTKKLKNFLEKCL